MATIKFGRIGQVTIPREIGRYMGVKESDSIVLIPDGDYVILRPLT